MKPGIVGSDVDTTAFYDRGVIVRGMDDMTPRLADVFSEAYITPPQMPSHSISLT